MEINQAALAVTAVTAIALGIVVYQRTPDRVWNRLFGLHAAGGGVWVFLNFLLEIAETPGEAGLWLRLTHPIVAMVICTVVDFAWTFPERIEYADRHRRMILYAIGVVFGTVAFAPNLYHDIQLINGMVLIDYGWPFAAFGLFTVAALGYTDVILLTKAWRLEGVQQVQVLWVLVGLAISHIVASITIIILPVFWGTTAYSGWGAVGYIATLGGMSYAIARHRLMKPETALRRSASTVLAVGVVVVPGVLGLRLVDPVLMGSEIPPQMGYAAVGVVMGLLITVLHGRITAYLNPAEGSGGDTFTVQAETASQILRTLDLKELMRILTDALADALGPEEVAVYTRSRFGESLVPAAVCRDADGPSANGRAPIDLSSRVLDLVRDGSLITRDQVFRFVSMHEARRLSLAMDEIGAQVIAPLIWEDELIGLLTLGAKRSGEMYVESEMRFISDVALQASLAMRNADLYAQTATLKDFNERILSQMDNAVVVTDDEYTIVVFNAAAERLFDIPARDALGASVDVLPAGIAHCIRASLSSGRVLSSHHTEMYRGGTRVPMACSASPLEREGEEWRQGVVAVVSDLTLIQELDRERAEAERLSLVRVISAGMAHEIRNPLVAIRTFAELAPRRLDDPEFRSNFLTVVREEIHRIDKLVGDLLTLSKPADAVVEEIDVDVICRRVMRAMSGVAEAKGVELELQLGHLEGSVRGDETRLHQALLNLVSNAIDAEPEGGRVSVQTRSCSRQEMDLCIAVHNPGSFIPEDQVEEIWRPFVSRKSKGTGLGLAICQTIVEEHRGAVSVESTLEGGTTFLVELPLSKSRTAVLPGSSE